MSEEEKLQLRELHEFFMKPPVAGKPNRAQQIDDLLSAVRAGKMGARLALYVAGALVALGGGMNALKQMGILK